MKKWFAILLAVFIVGLWIFCFFAIKNIISQRKALKPAGDYEAMRSLDPQREGGHLLPNLNVYVQGERTGHPVKVITNSKGFRNDREFDYDVPPGTLRILFLGDSFVDGMRTDQSDTIGYTLEQLLKDYFSKEKNPQYTNVEVMISGHNNHARAWYYYQEHGYKYHPDIVLLGVTLGNDLTWHNYKSDVLPYKREDGSLAVKFAAKPIPEKLWDTLLLPKEAFTPEDSLLDRIHHAQLFLQFSVVYKLRLFPYAVPPITAPFDSDHRRHVHAADFSTSLGLFYMPVMPEIEQMYEDFEEVLAGLNAQVKANGSRLSVVLFPTRMQVSKYDWDLLRGTYSLDQSKFDLTYPNRRMNEFCRKNGIDFNDVTPDFVDYHRTSKKKLYRPLGDMHFNEDGQALAARCIFKHLRSGDSLLKAGN